MELALKFCNLNKRIETTLFIARHKYKRKQMQRSLREQAIEAKIKMTYELGRRAIRL